MHRRTRKRDYTRHIREATMIGVTSGVGLGIVGALPLPCGAPAGVKTTAMQGIALGSTAGMMAGAGGALSAIKDMAPRERRTRRRRY